MSSLKNQSCMFLSLWLTVLTLTLLTMSIACNEYPFTVIDPCSGITDKTVVKVDPLTKADILIIVDNSGSMKEEQNKLVENFYVEDDPLHPEWNCPIDVNNVDPMYKNPSAALANELGKKCGFIQILAAYENDFRVGVITTDVGECDNRKQEAPNSWGRNPQRGCLQAPTGGFSGRKYLQKGDQDIAKKFKQILQEEVGTYGIADERGLDAAKFFLEGDTREHKDACGGDRDSFIREDAALVMIFLTDEDDCSHDGTSYLRDENEYDNCKAEKNANSVNGSKCYDQAAQNDLADVKKYIEYFKNVKGEGRSTSVRVAVIAGGMPEDGGVYASKCHPDLDLSINSKDVPIDMCFASKGASNYTSKPRYACHPDSLAAKGEERCCQAEAGTRYFQLSKAFGNQAFEDTICLNDFRQTMVGIARFTANVEEMDLNEEPASPAAIIVTNTRDSKTEEVDRIADGANPAGKDGWQFEPPKTIHFYGTAVPGPGDDIEVLTEGKTENSEKCK